MTRKPSFIDSHAHLTSADFASDLPQVIERAWDAGLESIVTIGAGDGLRGNASATQLAEREERIFATVGLHPHDAVKVADGWLERLEELAAHEKVVAIGEIGLDYYYNHSSPEVQRERFREQLELAKRLNKPIVIHDRDAHDDVWKMLEEVGVPAAGGVVHCFSGDLVFARRLVEAGFLISIPGIVTFPRAKLLQEVVAGLPLEKMVIETDCPWLAPERYRGKRNEPAYVVEVAAKVAQLKRVSVEDVGRVTTLAAQRLFRLPGATLEPSIAYRIRDAMYLNITNRCTLACSFCQKFVDFEVKGHFLKLPHEPSVEDIFLAVGQPEQYDEVVFCGYGEPTLRLEVVKAIATRLKRAGARRIRLNTDGLANLVYGRNIIPELVGVIDAVSVSLNAPDAASYASICRSPYGEEGYRAVCEFIVEAKQKLPEVVASVVACPGLDLEACRRKADELGVPLRVREYMNVG
jgi:TatD DNase family protein